MSLEHNYQVIETTDDFFIISSYYKFVNYTNNVLHSIVFSLSTGSMPDSYIIFSYHVLFSLT